LILFKSKGLNTKSTYAALAVNPPVFAHIRLHHALMRISVFEIYLRYNCDVRRIAFVTNSLTGGGAERSMNLVSNELLLRGFDIALIPINSSPFDQVIPRCKVYPVERTWKSGVLETLKSVNSFNRIVRDFNPDIVVLNCDLPELMGACLISKRRIVGVEHSDKPWASRINQGRLVRAILKIKKIRWVAVSAHLRVWPRGQEPDAVIVNSINCPTKPLSELRGSDVQVPLRRLFFVGRLAHQKQPNWLLEISKATGLPLIIIGDGPLREQLEVQVRKEGLKVEFKGHMSNPWEQALPGDLLLMPSAFEGDGMVVLEAIQVGLPVLLADIFDLRRFEFPIQNYCLNVKSFIEQIEKSRHNIATLRIPHDLAKKILDSRKISVVGATWEKFLNSLEN
jgi:glycosyltransferase involved in cell wall biosynthesis